MSSSPRSSSIGLMKKSTIRCSSAGGRSAARCRSAVDRTCGDIDRFVEIMFRTPINDLDDAAMVATDERFGKLCRVIALTERRGYWQVEVLLRHPTIQQDRQLMKIFGIIKQDEPRHWTPYEAWLQRSRQRDPKWWERCDRLVHPFGAAGAEASGPVPDPAAAAPDRLGRRPRLGRAAAGCTQSRACLI